MQIKTKEHSNVKEKKPTNDRLGQVGGEAVLDGVMMRAGTLCATACRTPDGEIAVAEQEFISARKKHRFCNLPIIRGVVSFAESMKLSFGALNVSAAMMGADEEMQESRFEKWLKKTFGKSIYDFIMFIGALLGVALAVGLFFILPNLTSGGLEQLAGRDLGVWKAAVASGVKILLFVGYILLISLMPDIRKTFQYHGAEHKSIACYEAGAELTPENAKTFRRFHPRCGTSFMFVMSLLGLLIAMGIRILLEVGLGVDFELLTGSKMLEALIYTGIGLLTLPLIMGLGFEFLLYAGKHDNGLTRALSAPGLWMQRLTTKEPDTAQLECAIVALKCALHDRFPDFDKSPYIIKGKKILEGTSETTGQTEAAPGPQVPETDAPLPDRPQVSASPVMPEAPQTPAAPLSPVQPEPPVPPEAPQ